MSGLQSLKEQNILTTRLGEQAITALSILLRAFQKKKSWVNDSVDEIYEALSLLLLGKMFGLYAKERNLLLMKEDNVFTSLLFSEKQRHKMTEIFGELDWISQLEYQKIETLLTTIEQNRIDYQRLDVEQLGSVYEQIMELSIENEEGHLRLVDDEKRRSTGAHYTPRILCDFTVEQALSKLLPKIPTSKDILSLRVCDPAMGSGAFLIGVLRFLTRQLVLAWQREGKDASDLELLAKEEIAQTCLFGVDINPRAVQLAQLSIWLEVGSGSFSPRALDLQLLVGNSLLDSQDGSFDTGKDIFDWKQRFPLIFQGNKKGFDLIVGNPPFINCIRGNLDPFVKEFIKKRYSIITGSADLSYYFLELGSELIHEKGVIGLVLPRVSMGAKALRKFRCSPLRPKPFLIYSADHYDFFYNADIKTVIYILGQAKSTQVSNSDTPIEAEWFSTKLENSSWWSFYQGNWWLQFSLACAEELMPDTQGAKALKSLGFEVHGGLTTDDFYKIQVEELENGDGLKLLTSGGIDPNESFWGKGNQKFRKQNFRFPRIVEGEYSDGNILNYSRSLQRKLKRSRRPKIIIANLTKKFEAFLDSRGEYQGATATQTIYHQDDSVEKLRKLCDLFHSDYGNKLFHHVLRYNAMHANISVEKEFLLEFPVINQKCKSDH